MRYYTEAQWLNAMYKDRWGDNPYNRSRVEAGELPEAYIGRRTIMVNEGGCTLLTEGFHFMVDDEEGVTVPWHEHFTYIEVYFPNGTSICIRTKRDSYSGEELEAFVMEDIKANGGLWYSREISEQEARENYDFSDFGSWPIF